MSCLQYVHRSRPGIYLFVVVMLYLGDFSNLEVLHVAQEISFPQTPFVWRLG